MKVVKEESTTSDSAVKYLEPSVDTLHIPSIDSYSYMMSSSYYWRVQKEFRQDVTEQLFLKDVVFGKYIEQTEYVWRAELLTLLTEYMETLDSGSCACFISRFGLSGDICKTYVEVAKHIGKSETYAYVKLQKVYDTLYDWLKEREVIPEKVTKVTFLKILRSKKEAA